jgi:hypothetical protein
MTSTVLSTLFVTNVLTGQYWQLGYAYVDMSTFRTNCDSDPMCPTLAYRPYDGYIFVAAF